MFLYKLFLSNINFFLTNINLGVICNFRRKQIITYETT